MVSELATGRAADRRYQAIAGPFGRLVSNITAGPVTPRASKLIDRADPRRERIARDEGACAEQAHLLAFVEQEADRTIQRRPRRLAATSSMVATPIPSSPAPGPAKVLS